jgi:D-tyrosyl-tRNA(Tyr) deacylase
MSPQHPPGTAKSKCLFPARQPARSCVFTFPMKAVVQRVRRAAVHIDGQTVGAINAGLLILLGIGKDDTAADIDWMIHKLLGLRIFPDEAGKMNQSVTEIGGGLLVVSQFTLYGDVRRGFRPGFSDAMPPGDAEKFYTDFMAKLRAATALPSAEGRFGAMMDVELVNDGPVTILLDSPVEQASRLFPGSLSNRTGETPVQQFTPFEPTASVAKTRRELPHWEQPGCTYFVTFRLADSVPASLMRQYEEERDQPAALERFHTWLDQGHGECWLNRPDIAAAVESAFRHFDGQRYQLGAFVVMPNHVHALVTPLTDWTLPQILHSWKSFTAHEINRLLQRTGPVWQDESFDHLVRDATALAKFQEYIRQNPTMLNRRPACSEPRPGEQAGRLFNKNPHA